MKDLEKRAKTLPEDDENAHEEFARVLLNLVKLMTQRAREERRANAPATTLLLGGPAVDRLAAAIERATEGDSASNLRHGRTRPPYRPCSGRSPVTPRRRSPAGTELHGQTSRFFRIK